MSQRGNRIAVGRYAPFLARYGTAEKIELIVTTLTSHGLGTESSPTRVVTQLWTLEGELIAEWDPIVDGEA